MPMNDFNRTNPFVVMMRKHYTELTDTSMTLVRTYITLFGISIVAIILSLILHNVTAAVLVLAPLLYFGFLMFVTLKHSDMLKVNQMIYGNEYKDINVNAEKILDTTMTIMYLKGKMSHIIETCNFFCICNALLITCLMLLNAYKLIY